MLRKFTGENKPQVVPACCVYKCGCGVNNGLCVEVICEMVVVWAVILVLLVVVRCLQVYPLRSLFKAKI